MYLKEDNSWGGIPSNQGQKWAHFHEKMLQDTNVQIFANT